MLGVGLVEQGRVGEASWPENLSFPVSWVEFGCMGFWQGPLGLRECLPTHLPHPLLCLGCLSPGDCPILASCQSYLIPEPS